VAYVIEFPRDLVRDCRETDVPSGPGRNWLDQWVAVRWRALGTWLVLSLATGLFLDHGYSLVTAWISFVLVPLAKAGIAPPPRLLELCFIFGALSWFQPVLLRLGAGRCALWVVSYVLLGLGCASVFPDLFYGFRMTEAVVVTQMCGIPGLTATGARRRAWLSLFGGVLSLGALLVYPWGVVFWSWLAWVLVIINLPYAVVMLHGTARIKRRHAWETSLPQEI